MVRSGWAAVTILGFAAGGAWGGWTGRPDVTASFRTFRTDTELRLSGTAAYSLGGTWDPQLRWGSSGRMSHVGALDRDKRDSSLNAILRLVPWNECTLDFATRAWRRRDIGVQVIERGTGAAAEGAIAMTGPMGLALTQSVAAIRDRVTSVGLGGRETDNGGTSAESEIRFSRSVAGREGMLQLRRSMKDVQLDGTDDRTLGLRLDGIPGTASFEAFSRERRYRTGATTELRTEAGRSVQLVGSMVKAVSWEYRGTTSTSSYREGTNQDFSTASQDLRVQLKPSAFKGIRPFLGLNLNHQDYDERDRTVYDREDLGRVIEAGCALSSRDSVLVGQVGHQLSLNRNEYADVTNFSDHDIRDQRLNADVAWKRRSTSLTLSLTRRRNDLVYIDAQRSANTVRNTEYEATLGYGVARGRIRWSQSGSISARYATYRFQPDANTLNRRGTVESRLAAKHGNYDIEVQQRWLWDDNGPYRRGLFTRLELTDDIEIGAAVSATWGRWKIAPGLRQRWRLVYGSGGRKAGLETPAQVERRASIDLEMPLGARRIAVAATRVARDGAGYWEASAEVSGGA